MFALWKGGLVYYGGLLGAGLAALWYVRAKKMPAWDVGDAVAPGLALGQAIGRLGCLMAGCCYGAACDLPWAVVFIDPRGLGRLGVPLHPVQVYEALANLVLFPVLYWVVAPRRRVPGRVFGWYLVLYPAVRFGIEFFRDDPRGDFGALSTGQAWSIPLWLTGLWILAVRRARS